MNNLETILEKHIVAAFKELFDAIPENLEFQATRKDFEGDITFVTFPFLRISRKSPEQTGELIGNYLVNNVEEVDAFNVVKGFLNLVVSNKHWLNVFSEIKDNAQFGIVNPEPSSKASMVEYSSPNTNKPLHLGHIRNNLLGHSVSEILKASGERVFKVQIINDRGIHICKSMVAWQKFGENSTPESTGLKGDKLVGNYYVKFDQEYKAEIETLVNSGSTEDEAKKNAPLFVEAQEMLLAWEAGDSKVLELWKRMNQWVYEGFEQTYNALGITFDKNYYESETYILGKHDIEKGLEKGVFFKKEDGSVWIDLTEDGLDEKIVLRSDGTSVYMTQDIGTAIKRFQDFDITSLTYVVGNEQDYHFKVLFIILSRLGYEWASHLHHLSYGMVDLPSGRMKSREGTVVDADDLLESMFEEARVKTEEKGKLEGYSKEDKNKLYRIIGLGALKYYILKVDPKKKILFNPEESIDFNGNTGPFIQYTYARIQSLKRRGEELKGFNLSNVSLTAEEKELIKSLNLMPGVIAESAANKSPAIVANYVYDTVKLYNNFYQNNIVINLQDKETSAFRLALSNSTGGIIKSCLSILGIESPERM